MLTAVRQMPGGRPNNRSLYFGGQGFKVDGKTFDAMTEEHFSIAMREAESHVGRINVVMVGFWNRDKPELGDPNSRVVEFPFTWNPN
ncbi:MAG: hypothetical protein NT003_04335, partial [Candidatus Magasanikbacteria bacterium]|nr:hypothetical protein [Candidatus Magasanikbacteria bacterium]